MKYTVVTMWSKITMRKAGQLPPKQIHHSWQDRCSH